MKNNFYLIALIVVFFLTSCENKATIEGLWIIKSVKVGEQEMTPNARWMRFNSDFTQESGNGWFQHSIGTWDLNSMTNELSMVNSNGLNDAYGPFNLTMDQDTMIWNRTEDEQIVQVTLMRSTQLPTAFGDKIIGLWKLEEAVGDGNYFKKTENSESVDYILFRWDKRFVIGTETGKLSGVYNVHGHKPEVELIPYGEQYKRDFWKIDFERDAITLSLLNTDSIVVRKFKRIHEFPNQ